MAERKPTESKFAGIFQNAAPVGPEPAPERAEMSPPTVVRPLGRPPGKRSDPDWKQFSVLLKKQTQRKAVAILRAETAESRDLSDLLQEILEQWIAGRGRA
jgi:hypothetical protein